MSDALYPLGNLLSSTLNKFPIVIPPIPSHIALNLRGITDETLGLGICLLNPAK